MKPASGRLTHEMIQTNIEMKMRDENGKPLYLAKENVTKIFGDFEKRKIDTFQILLKMFNKEQVLILKISNNIFLMFNYYLILLNYFR